jgi:hypothetical protein
VTTVAETNMETLLADVTAFRSWVGAGTAEQAKARIYIAAEDEGSYTRPFALIATQPGELDRAIAGGATTEHIESGTVFVLFEDDASGTHEEAFRSFGNHVGGIIDGLCALAGRGTYLHVRAIELDDIQRSDLDQDDDVSQALFAVEWGV